MNLNYIFGKWHKLRFVKYKINIESNWNQLIFEKFQNQLSINEEEIKNKLKQNILEQNYSNFQYNLSQIIFEVKSNESFEKKYKKILKSISNQGFKNASNLYSIAENAKTGGNIGWINKTQLSNTIIEVIKI